MAQTTGEVRAEIARTRAQLGQTFDELNARIDNTKRYIPLYGMDRRRLLVIGGVIGATTLMAFVALQARNQQSLDLAAFFRRRIPHRGMMAELRARLPS